MKKMSTPVPLLTIAVNVNVLNDDEPSQIVP